MSVCHSIPDGVGLAVETPVGTVIHTVTSNWTPPPWMEDNGLFGFRRFRQQGVLLMLSDLTNVERPGFTQSERIMADPERLLQLHRNKRVIIAAFSTNLHRSQQILQAASKFNRKVALMGRSMIQNVNLAMDLGYIDADRDILVPMEDAGQVPDKN